MDYTIKPGDNLSTIAKANNTTVGALASLNKLSNPNKIVAGQTLKLGVPTTNTNVANTAFNAPITQPQAVPPTINATTIGTQTPIPVPTTMPNNAPTTMPATIPTDNFAESQMLPEPDKTDAQKFQERSIFDILQGTQELAGKSAFEAQQQDLAGVQAKQAEYKAISDKIRSRQAQLQQEYAAINQSPMSFAARSGYESAVRAAAESEIGALNAQAQAVAGDYEMAVQTAQRAVDAKYKPILEKLEIQKAQLEAIKPLLARDEQKQAREMDYLLKQEERSYNERINNEKQIQSVAMLLAQNGQNPGIVKDATTALEAIQMAGSKLQDPKAKLELQSLRLDIQRKQLENALIGQPTQAQRDAEKKALKTTEGQNEVLQDKLQLIDVIENSSGISQRVGTNIFSRKPTTFGGGLSRTLSVAGIPSLISSVAKESTGSGQSFAGAVHRLASQEFINNLINAKAQGATFGALTDREGDALRSAATQLNDWEIKDKKGNPTGVWNIDQKTFMQEVNRIKTLTQKAMGTTILPDEQQLLDEIYGGQIDPSQYYR